MTEPHPGAPARTALPKRIGTIGAGRMAEAILRGLLRAGIEPPHLVASDPDPGRRDTLSRELGIRTCIHNVEVASSVDLAVLAVKPDQLEVAARDLPREGGPVYLSILAGRTLADLERQLGPRVARAMPNTPALIGAGISALALSPGLGAHERAWIEAVLASIGDVVSVPESKLDAVTGLSGSGPAYVYLVIEALTDAGVREGLPADIARRLAAQTVAGAGRMVLETGVHPALLREQVTSPGGTTAAGLAALEHGRLRSALGAAVAAATRRARELAQAR